MAAGLAGGLAGRPAGPRGAGRAAPGVRVSTNQLPRANAARASLEPVKTLSLPPTNTMASNSATPCASTMTVFCAPAAVAFRAKTLWEIAAVAPVRTATADPGLSRISAATIRTRDPLPMSMATRAAPLISTSDIESSESDVSTPVPSGVAASPTMRKPSSAASVIPMARIAEARSDAVPGSRRVAPCGTLLTSRT